MSCYCLKCGENTKCAVCGDKKSKFIKKQEAKSLLSNLGIKTLLS